MMMPRFALAVALMVAQAVSAKRSLGKESRFSANSKFGKKLMAHARRVNEEPEFVRNLDERNYYWMKDYSIQFEKCHELLQVRGEEGGGGDDESALYKERLVEFNLCPTDSCIGGETCEGGAQYIVNLQLFVDSYTESMMEVQEYECEQIRENCNNNNCNDEEACENNCFREAGREDCIEDEDEEEFEIQRYLECDELENNGNNNGGGNYGGYANRQFYVGPYCKYNRVHLGVFEDAGCITRAEDGVYEALNYGKTLPYSSESIVKKNCVSCKEPNDDDQQNADDAQDNDEVIALCEEMYMESGRCETNLDINYKDETACEFINSIIPRLEKAATGESSGGKAAKAFAWIFGITTFALLGFIYYIFSVMKKKNINLADKDGSMA